MTNTYPGQIIPAYAADGRPCSREAFYALACDPARSVVVEACAGAGKTWMLVSRMLRALLAGARPQDILAITFTRKAAGEMRERLNTWLAELALAPADQQVQELRLRGLSEPEAQRLAPTLAGLHEQVLASGRVVGISTFHAWFTQLMRAAPHELLDRLGLQPGMGLLEDTTELQPALLRRFQAKVAASAVLLQDYTALLERHGRQRLGDWLSSTLERRIEIELADAAGTLADSVAAPARLWPDCAGLDQPLQRWQEDAALRSLLAEAASALGAHKGKRPQDAGAALRQALDADPSDHSAGFDAAWAALFTGVGEPRKLGDLPAFEAAVAALQTLAAQVQQQLAHDDHRRMVGLVRLLLVEWQALKRGRALADMNDLERCALLLLSDPVASGWVQQRLDAQLRHLLIDEFQDTSPLQWQALLAWLSAYAGAGGGTNGRQPLSVFIVGDPKQSIYRFRRAEPRVFQAAQAFVQQAFAGVRLACDHTRRNAPEVVGLLNQVFGQAQEQGELADFRPHSTEVETGPLPALRQLPEVKRPPRGSGSGAAETGWRDSLQTPRAEAEQLLRAQEAAWVAKAVAQMVASEGRRPGQIMVLSRKRRMLGLVAQALRALGLPCVAAEALALADLPEAADLIALLDVLASPGHDLSLAQALKSPLFGASDDELLALSRHAAGAGWWSALRRWDQPPASLARARELLDRWAPLVQRLPPHDLLDRIVFEGDVLARCVAAARPERRQLAAHAVQSLLAQALALDGGRYATPYNFVRALRQRRVAVPALAAQDAVQLLTVHGAKGLEAEVVMLVDCAPEPPSAGRPGVVVDWPVQDASPAAVALLANTSRCPPSLQALQQLEQALQAREAMNLLYVAMTRARGQLVISCTAPHRSEAGASWWSRLALAAQIWRPDATGPAASVLPGDDQVLLTELATDWVLPPAQPAVAAASVGAAQDEAAARLGQAVHRWLEWAAGSSATTGLSGQRFPPMDAAALARAAAAEQGLPAAQAGEVQRLGQQVLDSAELAQFFHADGLLWAGNEVPMAVAGQMLRIDRLVQLRGPAPGGGPPGSWWVLDYKLNHAPQALQANRAQLAGYRDAVAAQQPGEPVFAAFVSAGGRLLPLAG